MGASVLQQLFSEKVGPAVPEQALILGAFHRRMGEEPLIIRLRKTMKLSIIEGEKSG